MDFIEDSRIVTLISPSDTIRICKGDLHYITLGAYVITDSAIEIY